jgi:hypothetical protein
MLKAFSRVGYLSPDQLKDNLGIADRRVTNFGRDGYIEKVPFIDKKSKNSAFAYRLTDKGKTLCSNQLQIESFYRSSSAIHDLALADKYFTVEKDLRDSWITESQWRSRFEEYLADLHNKDCDRWEELYDLMKEGLISPPDGGYITREGVEIALEVITSSYGETELLAKENFVQTLEVVYNQIRV